MSKPKHKTVEKWVAWLHRPYDTKSKLIRTLKIEVVETAKQFRIEGSDAKYREAMGAVGYRHLINKEGNDCLFDTEMAALRQLEKYFTRQDELAASKARDASENLRLITESVELVGNGAI